MLIDYEGEDTDKLSKTMLKFIDQMMDMADNQEVDLTLHVKGLSKGKIKIKLAENASGSSIEEEISSRDAAGDKGLFKFAHMIANI